MRVEMSYGRHGLELELPEDWQVTIINKKSMPVVNDPTGAVAKALASPVGSSPLAALAGPDKSACILICDITRPVPNHLFLRPLVVTA